MLSSMRMGAQAEAAEGIVVNAPSEIVAEEGELSYTAPGSIRLVGMSCMVRPHPQGTDFTAIAAGSYHSLALHFHWCSRSLWLRQTDRDDRTIGNVQTIDPGYP